MSLDQQYETVKVDRPVRGVYRITLARPEARNAQNKKMTYELNSAFDAAAGDTAAKVVVLAGEGPHFNAGHDMRDTGKMSDFRAVSTWQEFDLPGQEGPMAIEQEVYRLFGFQGGVSRSRRSQFGRPA